MLYVFGILPSTFLVACFVLVCSQILLFIWPAYYKVYGRDWFFVRDEFVLHYVFVFIFIFF